MSDASDRLVGLTEELIGSATRLQRGLSDYKQACSRLVTMGEEGGSSTVERLATLKFSEKRERITSAIEEFEADRRQVRVTLMEVAEEEGSSFSDVARSLGISRQLAARLAGGPSSGRRQQAGNTSARESGDEPGDEQGNTPGAEPGADA